MSGEQTSSESLAITWGISNSEQVAYLDWRQFAI